MDQQGQMIKELWRLFLRQLKVLIGVGAIGVAITGFIAYILPPVYVSEAKILVEEQQIPNSLVKSTVTTAANERLQLIRQRLLTRENLIKVIESQELFVNRTDLTISEKISLLRDATKFRQIHLAGRGQRRNQATVSAFTISVRLSDPKKASGVANEFVTDVLSQNIRSRSERASDTLDFFRTEEKRLSDELNSLEAQMTQFKRENDGALPENLTYRRGELARIVDSDFDMQGQLLKLEESANTLKLRISAYEQGARRPNRQVSAEEAEIRKLEAALAIKRATFSETHRDVRTLKARIKALEATVPVRGDQPGGGANDVERAAMENQLTLIETQIEMAKARRERMNERRIGLAQSIEETPKIELALKSMNRRLEELQSRLAGIVKKRAAAETGERLEVNQQGERFEVIENALAPDKPVSPDRQKIFILGSGVSLALAGALAFLLEILNPALRSASQMERQLDLRPLATIPYIRTRREIAARRFKWGVFLLVIFIGTPVALYMLDTYYLPLQLLAEQLIDQAGLGEIVRSLEDRL